MKRLICWGGVSGQDSFRHIMSAYHSTAQKLGVETEWVPDRTDSREALTPGSTVFTVDVFSSHIGEAKPGVNYVIHNYGDHPLTRTADPSRLLRLQVHTNDAYGEAWDAYRHFDINGPILFQPWGADLLPEEFMPPTYNRGSAARALFVGAVWSDVNADGVEMGNELTIQEVDTACAMLGLPFERRTQIPTEEMIRAMRDAALCPGFAGEWQASRNYLPCRSFKSAAYGVLPLTNVPAMLDLLQGAALRGSVYEVMQEALRMDKSRYRSLVLEAQRAISPYTYAASLAAIDRAFEEMAA